MSGEDDRRRALPDDDLSVLDFMPPPPEGEAVTAHAGAPLEEGAAPADAEAVVESVRTVHDPEIPVNLYDLGLIYRLDIDESGDVSIDMTLTAPACPVAGQMPQMVADAVAGTEGVGRVEVHLVWDPPWTPAKMSEDARMALGMC